LMAVLTGGMPASGWTISFITSALLSQPARNQGLGPSAD
jgi:hypothetical protein